MLRKYCFTLIPIIATIVIIDTITSYLFGICLSTLNLQIRNGENSMINNLSTNINQNLKLKTKLNKFILNN